MKGSSGFAGEIGHMTVNPNGHACNCGNRGCWETEVGRDAILRAAGTSIAESSVSEVVRAAKAGDTKALAGLEEIADWVGIGLANLLNMIDPDVIVLGGHLAEIYPVVSRQVEARITRSRPLFETRARIALPALPLGSTIVGAAEVAFTALLNDPLNEMERSLALVAS
jgi:predicted NBD/HSP70 family sugar kinase